MNIGNSLHIFHLSRDIIVTQKENLSLTVEPELQAFQRANLCDPRILRQLEGNHTYLEAVHSINLRRALVYQLLATRVPQQQKYCTREQLGLYQRNTSPSKTDTIGISISSLNSFLGSANLGILIKFK